MTTTELRSAATSSCSDQCTRPHPLSFPLSRFLPLSTSPSSSTENEIRDYRSSPRSEPDIPPSLSPLVFHSPMADFDDNQGLAEFLEAEILSVPDQEEKPLKSLRIEEGGSKLPSRIESGIFGKVLLEVGCVASPTGKPRECAWKKLYIQILSRKVKNRYSWIGFSGIPKAFELLKEDAIIEICGSCVEARSLKMK